MEYNKFSLLKLIMAEKNEYSDCTENIKNKRKLDGILYNTKNNNVKQNKNKIIMVIIEK